MTDMGVVVIGVGMAGGVRVRDILNPHPHLKGVTLQGYVSRRDIDIPGATKIHLEDAVASPDVHAVVVCTENRDHENTVRKALEAGKHVLVEFPMVIAYEAVDPLYQLANKKGVVLYEENIALLTPQHLGLKQAVQTRVEEVDSISTSLEGSLKCDGDQYDARNGHSLYAGISQLQRVMDIMGDLTPVAASTEVTTDRIDVKVQLKTKQDRPVTIHIVREKTDKPKRVTAFCYKFKDGSEIDNNTDLLIKQTDGEPGLFMNDLIHFTEVVRGSRDNVYGKWLTTRSIEITSQLVSMTQ